MSIINPPNWGPILPSIEEDDDFPEWEEDDDDEGY